MERTAMDELVDRFYAEYLGCPVQVLQSPGVWVGTQNSERRYNGVFVMLREQSCVFSAPPEHLEWVRGLIAGKSVEDVWGEAHLRTLFGPCVERIVGPAWVGCADRESLRQVEARQARVLNRADARALWDLEVDCAPLEWRHAGIGLDLPVVIGCHVKSRLVAVAAYSLWSKEVAHIGVATHPVYRGQGYGKAVVSALSSYGIARGLTMQYRALQTNAASIGIATSLGYQHYGTTLSVGLTK